ncbi:hypothetical protein GCM10027359_25220 [Marilutibacter aestuarii]
MLSGIAWQVQRRHSRVGRVSEAHPGHRYEGKIEGFRPLRVRVPFVLAKGTKTAGSIGRRRGFAAPVPCAPRPWRHGAQTRFAQTRAPLRPPRPAVLGGLKVAKIKIKIYGNGHTPRSLGKANRIRGPGKAKAGPQRSLG